jgi:sigma-B regulation protein RsbU (phosphoserine phosphatase)
VSERHFLTLRNDRAEVARLTTWVDELGLTLALPPETTHALQLCLDEAVTNIVSHAFEPNTSHDVHIALWRDDTVLHAEVTDDGRPFDPLAYEPPPAPKDLQSAQIGGLGIRLMRGFADQITYQRSGPLNRLLLSFRLT